MRESAKDTRHPTPPSHSISENQLTATPGPVTSQEQASLSEGKHDIGYTVCCLCQNEATGHPRRPARKEAECRRQMEPGDGP